MSELRWVEGRDYSIDARYADGVTHSLPGLAVELVATRPDLLLVPSDEDVRLLAHATKTIPIVFAITQDPVGNALVASLRRPGGNATGLTTLSSELSAKRLQLLKEAFPRVTHIVLLFEPDNVGSISQANEIGEAASHLKLRITPIALRQPADREHEDRQGKWLHDPSIVPGKGEPRHRTTCGDRAIHDRPTLSVDPADAGDHLLPLGAVKRGVQGAGRSDGFMATKP
jgi:hypothetical protein